MQLFKDTEVRKAFYLGAICTISYMAIYFARNILGVITPEMIETTGFTIEFIGTLSTSCMIFYAVGQLINGLAGDIINAKYMVSGGLFLAGICNFIVPFSSSSMVMLAAYSMSGFFLSMIYAPITKVVAENTLPEYAVRCCLGYTVASFLGAPAASIASIFFNWKNVFILCSLVLMLMGISCFIVFTIFEKNDIIQYNRVKKDKTKGSVKVLIQNSIIKFTIVSVLTGIVRTSVVFWIPTYLSQYLGFSSTAAAAIFTAITLIKSASPFYNVFIYERILKRNMNAMLLLMFSLSTVCFALMFVMYNPILNTLFLLLALVSSAGASTMLFSVYCPSLSHTGMVSSATGFLDFMSYVAAATANQLFANAVSDIGWGNLILVWAALMLVGVIASLPFKKTKTLSVK